MEGRAVEFETEGAGLALEVRIGRQPVGDSEPGRGGGGQVSGVSLRACQGSSRSTCQMGRAVLQQTLAGLVRRVFCDHEGPVMGLGGDGCQGVVRGAKRVAMHGEVLGPALGPEPRDAVDEIVREDRQDCGTTDVIPGVGGEPRAARAVDVEVGGEGRNEVKSNLPGHIGAQGRTMRVVSTSSGSLSPRRPLWARGMMSDETSGKARWRGSRIGMMAAQIKEESLVDKVSRAAVHEVGGEGERVLWVEEKRGSEHWGQVDPQVIQGGWVGVWLWWRKHLGGGEHRGGAEKVTNEGGGRELRPVFGCQSTDVGPHRDGQRRLIAQSVIFDRRFILEGPDEVLVDGIGEKGVRPRRMELDHLEAEGRLVKGHMLSLKAAPADGVVQLVPVNLRREPLRFGGFREHVALDVAKERGTRLPWRKIHGAVRGRVDEA